MQKFIKNIQSLEEAQFSLPTQNIQCTKYTHLPMPAEHNHGEKLILNTDDRQDTHRPRSRHINLAKPYRAIFLPLIILLLYLPLSSAAQVKRVLPKEFKKLEFGMSMEAFADKRKTVEPSHLSREKFRYVWVESFSDKYPFQTAKYYFSDKEEHPFYEVILFYSDLTARDNWLTKYFGNPNFKNNTEWQLVSKNGQQFRAWRYEDRLVITALLPGTEWEERE